MEFFYFFFFLCLHLSSNLKLLSFQPGCWVRIKTRLEKKPDKVRIMNALGYTASAPTDITKPGAANGNWEYTEIDSSITYLSKLINFYSPGSVFSNLKS